MTIEEEHAKEVAQLKKRYHDLWNNTGEWYAITYAEGEKLMKELRRLKIETVNDLHRFFEKKR